MNDFKAAIQTYFDCLTRSDLTGMLTLFTEDALITSPFLKNKSPEAFFSKVFEASANSDIHIYNIFQSTQNPSHTNVYFRYDWTLNDGTQVSFDCIDLFKFNSESRITQLTILYDTHPIREQVGDKYG